MPKIHTTTLLFQGASGVITIAVTIWFLHRQQRRSNNNQLKEDTKTKTNTNTGTNNTNESNGNVSGISSVSSSVSNVSRRGLKISQSSALPYFNSYFKALANPCHESQNRKGYIALCMAENKLIIPELSKRLSSSSVATIGFENEMNFCYNNNNGMEHARVAVARFITKRFIMNNNNEHNDDHHHHNNSSDNEKLSSVTEANPNHIVLSSGAASILNLLMLGIADEKEVILIPAPYYAAFDYDLAILSKCIPYPVHMSNPSIGPQDSELEAIYQRVTVEEGLVVKGLLLTNPNNPLGTIYSPEVIRNCIAWARSKKMHTIVDEIYALSVHDNNNNEFQSVTRILNNNLGDDVHFIWALSKDFGSSGFRVGILYSQNETIISIFSNINMFASVSHPMQSIVADLLSDDKYIDQFLDKSRSLLKASYDIVTSELDTMEIPFIAAKACIFVYVDFSSLLRVNSFQGESELATLFEDYARIVMTPGCAQHDDKPGRFRICYAFVTPEVLTVAMVRLASVCRLLRQHGWGDIRNHIDENTFLIS